MLTFPFIYTCTQYFHHIHPPIPFSYILPFPWYLPPDRTCFTLLSSVVWKKIRHFCLLKISIQRVSIWHFHVCIYYIPNWFILSICTNLWYLNQYRLYLRVEILKRWKRRSRGRRKRWKGAGKKEVKKRKEGSWWSGSSGKSACLANVRPRRREESFVSFLILTFGIILCDFILSIYVISPTLVS
jgi:hypothetical protein